MPADIVIPSSLRSAFYHQPGVEDPNGRLLLLRGALTNRARTERDTVLRNMLLAASRSQQGTPIELDLETGERGVCIQVLYPTGAVVPSRIWLSTDTFGYLEPATPVDGPVVPPTAAALADLLRKLLPDLP
ncbi:hypothetical protein [Frankia gtarii]|uniref:hypothetical protein n=1 Tax=Frankia gtarii TaxID=2950102 RepID=UPI0021BDF80D|nr:hypothetical protein [Frankia gtarii]